MKGTKTNKQIAKEIFDEININPSQADLNYFAQRIENGVNLKNSEYDSFEFYNGKYILWSGDIKVQGETIDEAKQKLKESKFMCCFKQNMNDIISILNKYKKVA